MTQYYSDDDTEGLIWQTTASDNLIEITYAIGYIEVYDGAVAPEGSQVAELNAWEDSTLYQTVLTTPGSTLNWQLQHRARTDRGLGSTSGYDTMFVVIMSEELAQTVTSQEDVNAIIGMALVNPTEYYTEATNGTAIRAEVETGEYAGTVVWRITDYAEADKTESSDDPDSWWVRYVASYDVPEGQYLTRFFFSAGATAYDNNVSSSSSLARTVGNLLDDVAFTTDILAPNEGETTLYITKTVEGLSADDMDNYSVSFEVTYTDSEGTQQTETITISNFTLQIGGSYVGRASLTIELDPTTSSLDVTVKEVDATVDNYDLATEVSYTDSGDTITPSDDGTITVTLNDAEVSSAAYTNTYTLKTYDLTIYKYTGADEESGTPLEGAQFSVEKVNTVDSTTEAVTLSSNTTNTNGEIIISGLELDTIYKISETKVPSGYVLADPIYIKVVNDSGTLVGYVIDPTTWGQKSGTETMSCDYTPASDSSLTTFAVKIQNTQLESMPQTGFSGALLVFAAGGAIVAAGFYVLFGRKSKLTRAAHAPRL